VGLLKSKPGRFAAGGNPSSCQSAVPHPPTRTF
jgi:hypothetical protein